MIVMARDWRCGGGSSTTKDTFLKFLENRVHYLLMFLFETNSKKLILFFSYVRLHASIGAGVGGP